MRKDLKNALNDWKIDENDILDALEGYLFDYLEESFVEFWWYKQDDFFDSDEMGIITDDIDFSDLGRESSLRESIIQKKLKDIIVKGKF